MGCVSRGGIVPYSMTQDTAGPICRTVEDAAKTLSVIAGYDSEDPLTAWSFPHRGTDYSKGLEKGGLEGKRIGVLRSFFGKEEVNGRSTASSTRPLASARGGCRYRRNQGGCKFAWLTSEVMCSP